MIGLLLALRSSIEKLFHDKHDLNIKHEQLNKLNTLEINTPEWNLLVQLHRVLKGFYYATRPSAGQSYSSIGIAYLVLLRLKLKLFLINDKDNNVVVNQLKKSS